MMSGGLGFFAERMPLDHRVEVDAGAGRVVPPVPAVDDSALVEEARKKQRAWYLSKTPKQQEGAL